MFNIFKKLLFVCSLLIFTGCTIKSSLPEFSNQFEFKVTNFEEIIENLLDKASNQIFPNMEMNEILIVPNFAEVTTLRSDTRLSFVLSELLKDKLVSKYSYTIREIELSNKFRLGSEGFKVLTRNANSINGGIEGVKFAVVGYYTFTKNQMILFLKLIDIKDGKVLASSTYSTDLTREMIELNKIIIKNPSLVIYQPMIL